MLCEGEEGGHGGSNAPQSSGAASTTTSHSRSAARSAVTVRRAREAATCAAAEGASVAPFFTALSPSAVRERAMASRLFLPAAGLASTPITRMPAAAVICAIPVPMRPMPRTPTVLMARAVAMLAGAPTPRGEKGLLSEASVGLRRSYCDT